MAGQDHSTTFQWFELTDSLPGQVEPPDLFHTGSMKANLSPKPAFFTYRELIRDGCSGAQHAGPR